MLDVSALKREAYADLGEPTTPAAGPVFYGLFRLSDVNPLGVPAIVGDYELRYLLESAALNVGDVLIIRGQQYRVADDPYRIGDGREAVVSLREVTA